MYVCVMCVNICCKYVVIIFYAFFCLFHLLLFCGFVLRFFFPILESVLSKSAKYSLFSMRSFCALLFVYSAAGKRNNFIFGWLIWLQCVSNGTLEQHILCFCEFS